MPNPKGDPPFVAQETLKAWQNKNHPWLELSDVHKETTENIRVTVIPFYMGCRESHANSVYWGCTQSQECPIINIKLYALVYKSSFYKMDLKH
ncbi:unnamed protein product [Acanthoscelides obtectus]|nr:unnamed protein product [Acanthoscelides obtectus]CAH2008104.1 unnamed protein product [Acanthoscelides obtectus]CAK1677257.1 Polymerase delta-interacting protein 2 [Acanthoscelides obtectus]CAK1677332.1 Polymerase delta-interacting protein 2 [Acanthoscelides obtectus]